MSPQLPTFERPEYNITAYSYPLSTARPNGEEIMVGESDFLFVRDIDDVSINPQISIQNQNNFVDMRIGDNYDFRKTAGWDGVQRKFDRIYLKNDSGGIGNIKFEVLSGVNLNRLPVISADTIKVQFSDSLVTVNTTASSLTPNPLANRVTMLVSNVSGATLFIGGSSVTTLTGTRLQDGQSVSFNVIEAVDLYGIATGTVSARILEGA